MNPWFMFLLKSTLILSLLYIAFRILIRNETLFLQSRIILVLIVIFSIVIPFIYLPISVPAIIPDNIDPIITNPIIQEPVEKESFDTTGEIIEPVAIHRTSLNITTEIVLLSIYSIGVFISFCLFLYRLISVLLLIRRSQRKDLHGLKLNIINDDIPAFTFRKSIVISKYDFDNNAKAILTHELSHIKQGHFYDLLMMEIVKIIYWFNPLVYLMNKDIKEIHEYQADEYTIKSGIDTIKYQLLIVQKSVGQHRFALANSFNHCQIKNRITMMNKSKNRKRWSWKVATFLPLLVLLLMAFGRKGENPPEIVNLPVENPLENIVSSAETEQNQYDEFNQKIEIRKDGNYINNKPVSLEEIKDQDRSWREASNAPIFLLIDESIPLKRVDEVRESLKGNYWVVQATVDSDDLIYFAGDVSKLAKFTQGEWGDWIKSQLNRYSEKNSISLDRDYLLSYSFIIDKNGKVRDGHVVKKCEYPEINEAYNEILTQIPDWEPALRGNDKISVYWEWGSSNSLDKRE
jgi:beta-lactamase regulating signal transducer with metallopeptidase domain